MRRASARYAWRSASPRRRSSASRPCGTRRRLLSYLGARNIGIFSTDMNSFDFKMRKPEQVVASVMSKLKKHGKGIVLMHDFQHPTSLALPELSRPTQGERLQDRAGQS